MDITALKTLLDDVKAGLDEFQHLVDATVEKVDAAIAAVEALEAPPDPAAPADPNASTPA